MVETQSTVLVMAAATLALVAIMTGGSGREPFQAGLAGLNAGTAAKTLMRRLVVNCVVSAYAGVVKALPATGAKPLCSNVVDKARAKYRGDLAAWFGMAAYRPLLATTADTLAEEIEAFMFNKHCQSKSRTGVVIDVAGLKAAMAALAASPETKLR